VTDLWQLADLTTSWCVHTVATLRIADRVDDAERFSLPSGTTSPPIPTSQRSSTIEMVLIGGRRETLAAFREHAARCGSEVVAAGPQPAGNFVVECTRS
jgi:hypothetical protein